jgi:acetyl esterase/lipase
MPLDPHARRFLHMLSLSGPPDATRASVAERREALAGLMRLTEAASVAAVADHIIPGPGGPVPLRLYTPHSDRQGALPGLVYLHGGGLIAGGITTHDAMCRTLVAESGCGIVAVDYRLAPEHPFPAAIEDCAAAAAWVAAEAGALGLDPARLGIGGDSAGATLAALVCQAARAGGPRFAFQLLICPITDYAAETPSRTAFATGHLLDAALIARDLAHYCPAGPDAADPRLSPLRALDLAGLPPALIHTAECDPTRDEGAAYAERLREAGVPVRYACHAGLIHLFYGLTSVIPAARRAMIAIGAELREVVG